jgi:hypothetical protein
VCVWIYHIELKTHARSERKILIGFFYVSYETAGNFCFCHPVNTHTQRDRYSLTCKKDKDT